MYLLDANALIDANRDYYPLDRVPEFWRWLEYHGTNGSIKIPVEVHEETKRGADGVAIWARRDATVEALLLQEEASPELVQRVCAEGYAADLTDDELEQIGRDPLLISYALSNVGGRCVVSTERSKPSRIRANRHVPDVCRTFGIACYDTFTLVRELDFRTDWERRL